jgi:hypothetical protein
MNLFNYKNNINNIEDINHVNSFYNEHVEKLHKLYYDDNNKAMNFYTGDVYHKLFYEVAKKANPDLVLKHNDYFVIPNENGKYKLTNIQVDWHCYLNNKLVFICECKTFLSRGHLSVAVNDFRLIRRIYPNIPAIIFSGQKSLTNDSLFFYKEECDFEYFFVNENKKRSQRNPLFKVHNMLDFYEIERVMRHIRSLTQSLDP